MKALTFSRPVSREDWPLGVECAWPAAMHATPARAVVRPRARRWQLWLAAVAFSVSLWQLGQGSYIQAKAWLAQVLIKQAWARTLEGEAQAKPWPWADTWPVARITVPGRDIERFVLAGANGRTIAFGPGHVFGTPLPGVTALITGVPRCGVGPDGFDAMPQRFGSKWCGWRIGSVERITARSIACCNSRTFPGQS